MSYVRASHADSGAALDSCADIGIAIPAAIPGKSTIRKHLGAVSPSFDSSERPPTPNEHPRPSAAARRELLGWLAIMRDDCASRGDHDLAAACAEVLEKLGPSPRRARDEALCLLRRVAFPDKRDAPAAAAIAQAAANYFASRYAQDVKAGRAPVSEPDATLFAVAQLGYAGTRFPSERTIRLILGESACGQKISDYKQMKSYETS